MNAPGARRGSSAAALRSMVARGLVATVLVPTVLVATVLVATVLVPSTAGAAGDSGASSRVVGRGDILTSIIGWRGSGRAGSGAPPPCVWRTLSDAELEWLVSVSSQARLVELDAPLLGPLRDHLDDAVALPHSDLQARTCGRSVVDLRFVPRTEPLAATEQLQRRMVTRLPLPDPVTTPPPSVAAPVGEPVVVSIPDHRWGPVEGTIALDGVVAEVRADPLGVRVQPGDPAAEAAACDGPGRPYTAGTPVGELLADPGTCAVVHRTASGTPGRPDAWLGTVTVLWQARWRVLGGPWNDLGTIARTRVVAQRVAELPTRITWAGGRPGDVAAATRRSAPTP